MDNSKKDNKINRYEKIVKEKLAIERFELPRDEAIKLMKEKEEPTCNLDFCKAIDDCIFENAMVFLLWCIFF